MLSVLIVQVTPSYVIPVSMGNNVRSSDGTFLFNSYFSLIFFSKRKFWKVKHMFLTPIWKSLNPFTCSLLSEFSSKTVSAFLLKSFSFFLIVISSFFQRKCWWFVSSDLYPVVRKEWMPVSKLWDTFFLVEHIKKQMWCLLFSATYSLWDCKWIYTDMLLQKNLFIMLSLMILRFL